MSTVSVECVVDYQ